MSSSRFQISNKKIIDFYEKNPNLDFQAVNIVFIHLLEMLQNDLNKNINSSISSQILTEILNVKDNLNSINSSLYMKLQENKRDTIEEYKTILSNNLFQNNDKLDSLIQQNTCHLLDKTTILLNEVLPKSNESQLTSIKESIFNFEKSVSSDSAKILNAVNK